MPVGKPVQNTERHFQCPWIFQSLFQPMLLTCKGYATHMQWTMIFLVVHSSSCKLRPNISLPWKTLYPNTVLVTEIHYWNWWNYVFITKSVSWSRVLIFLFSHKVLLCLFATLISSLQSWWWKYLAKNTWKNPDIEEFKQTSLVAYSECLNKLA